MFEHVKNLGKLEIFGYVMEDTGDEGEVEFQRGSSSYDDRRRILKRSVLGNTHEYVGGAETRGSVSVLATSGRLSSNLSCSFRVIVSFIALTILTRGAAL